MRAWKTALQNGFISRRQRQAAQLGRQGQMYRELRLAWSTHSQRLWLEFQAMCVSRGWTRVRTNRGVRTIGCGTRFIVPRRTAARVGVGSRSSREQSAGTTTFFRADSASLSETTSAWRSTAMVRLMPCGVKAETTNRPDRSGTPADGNRLVTTPGVTVSEGRNRFQRVSRVAICGFASGGEVAESGKP